MRKNIKNKYKSKNLEISIITSGIAIIGYIVYLLILSNIKNGGQYDIYIILLSWVGIFLGVYILRSWYKLTDTLLSPYTLFVLFLFLFNYGQPIMWAFRIHIPSEIGQITMYRNFSVARDADIVKAQSLTLISILMFHFGAITSYKSRKRIKYKTKETYLYPDKREDSRTLKAIFYTSFIVSIFVVPITMYYTFSDFLIASVHGYGALYYSEFARTAGTIPVLLSKMFFTSLIGLLIGSKYDSKVKKTVYVIFAIYMIVYLLAGDRGSWIYNVFILIWLSHMCNKPIKFKTTIKYIAIGVIGIYITDVFVAIRNIGLSNINFNYVKMITLSEKSPIINAIFEMGSSMQPTIILQKFGWDIWPYENTYFLAILGMITNKLIYILDLPFALLSSWFSQEYLGIYWGAGFSLIAEALLNVGPILAPVIIYVEGFILTPIIYIEKGMNYKERPLKFFFAASSLSVFINLTRNELHLVLKNWFYGVILLSFLILIVRKLMVRRN